MSADLFPVGPDGRLPAVVAETCGRVHVDPPDVLHRCRREPDHASIIHKCRCQHAWFEANTLPPSPSGEQWECSTRHVT